MSTENLWENDVLWGDDKERSRKYTREEVEEICARGDRIEIKRVRAEIVGQRQDIQQQLVARAGEEHSEWRRSALYALNFKDKDLTKLRSALEAIAAKEGPKQPQPKVQLARDVLVLRGTAEQAAAQISSRSGLGWTLVHMAAYDGALIVEFRHDHPKASPRTGVWFKTASCFWQTSASCSTCGSSIARSDV